MALEPYSSIIVSLHCFHSSNDVKQKSIFWGQSTSSMLDPGFQDENNRCLQVHDSSTDL
jgi:hypothetical protein